MPDWKSLVSCRLQHLWLDGEVDADIVEELTAHLKDRYDELRGEGLSDREAVEATLNEMSDSDRFDLGRRKRQQQSPPRVGSRLVAQPESADRPLAGSALRRTADRSESGVGWHHRPDARFRYRCKIY